MSSKIPPELLIAHVDDNCRCEPHNDLFEPVAANPATLLLLPPGTLSCSAGQLFPNLEQKQ